MGNGYVTPTFLVVLNAHRRNVNQFLLPNPYRLGSRIRGNNYICPTFSGLCNAQCGNQILNCPIGSCRLRTPNRGGACKTFVFQGVPHAQLEGCKSVVATWPWPSWGPHTGNGHIMCTLWEVTNAQQKGLKSQLAT